MKYLINNKNSNIIPDNLVSVGQWDALSEYVNLVEEKHGKSTYVFVSLSEEGLSLERTVEISRSFAPQCGYTWGADVTGMALSSDLGSGAVVEVFGYKSEAEAVEDINRRLN